MATCPWVMWCLVVKYGRNVIGYGKLRQKIVKIDSGDFGTVIASRQPGTVRYRKVRLAFRNDTLVTKDYGFHHTNHSV